MLKTIISDKNTLKNSQLQQLYNNLNDTRNISFLLEEGKYAEDCKDDGAIQPQDIANQDGNIKQFLDQKYDTGDTPDSKTADPNEGNIVIEGLENFSFTDTPEEEIDLRVHFNKFIE